MKDGATAITPGTIILDIVSRYRETETVFKQLEMETGTCLCCQALFLPIGEAATRFGFDLNRALGDLDRVIRTSAPPRRERGRICSRK
ncbi:MAG: hypothetical protein AB2L22_04360 [Syntrophales bacterium]